eukprot:760554-Hanusia_phi.AAC.2
MWEMWGSAHETAMVGQYRGEHKTWRGGIRGCSGDADVGVYLIENWRGSNQPGRENEEQGWVLDTRVFYPREISLRGRWGY